MTARAARPPHGSASLTLAWSSYEGRDCLSVLGWSPDALGVLAQLSDAEVGKRVVLYSSDLVRGEGSSRGRIGTMSVPPFACRHVVRDGLHLLPRFPFLPGTSYTVLVARSLSGAAGAGDAVLDGDTASDDFDLLTIDTARSALSPSTTVLEVYPTASELPRNQLKLYLAFSAPMSDGFAARHLAIRSAPSGAPLVDALFSTDPELWDPERRRLTILFDPARLKRGLVPHRELGYPLQEGQEIEVVVDADFEDAQGQPLVSDAVRRYRIGRDERSRVEPARWRSALPLAGTGDPIVIRFDRPLDHALLQHCLSIIDANGEHVRGVAAIAPGEREWSYTPHHSWHSGARYEMRVDAKLEDLAGNSVSRVFDRDLDRSADAPLALDEIVLDVTPRSG
jgi:hypothetical protein